MIGPRTIRIVKCQGFTLMEMMIVMVIASIMTVLMIPEMKGSYEEALLRSNARKLGAAFKAAYSGAITTHKQHRVRINQEDSKLIVEVRTAEIDAPYMPLKQFDRRTSQLHPSVSLRFHKPKSDFNGQDLPPVPATNLENDEDHAKGIFLFQPDGTCKGSDIELRDRMGFGLLVHLNAITSRVQFNPLERIPQ